MLAQLVTDEAKPGCKEKWFVHSFLFPLVDPNDYHLDLMIISRLRTYTFVLFKVKSDVKLTWVQRQAVRTRDRCKSSSAVFSKDRG
jgi:hypothetical protein